KNNAQIVFFICPGGICALFCGRKMVRKAIASVHRQEEITTAPHSTAVSDANLQRLDRLANLGTLSAGIAHEIKNGLVPIRTFIQLMLEKSDDRELALTVERELKRIDSMVSQMLRFAAPKPAVVAPVRVKDVLEKSLRLLQHQIDEKMISVTRDYQAAPGTIDGDEAQLQQVVMNLLLNAVEAMTMNGVLTISTNPGRDQRDGPWLEIHVKDTGVGIPKENLDRIFEPFFTTKRNGTGLGLAISQRVIDEHHGRIEARSDAGKGATFVIILPAAR
ncbi:MAG TPA: ATP-binding protein, partial [Verrucomicrobiae bacterium]|nr:ATP-binding protein [Verrucomicrobiae bacterium]